MDAVRAFVNRFARWLYKKSMPTVLTGNQWSGTQYVDKYKRDRDPTPNELLAELKGIAWACISINASACASYAPSLYVTTSEGQARPKCRTKGIAPRTEDRLRRTPHLVVRTKGAVKIEQVTDHPLVDLLSAPTPPGISLNSFDLWELTQIYLEVHGRAYWYLEGGPLGIPQNIWVMPAQNMTAKREPKSKNLVD
jgi:hypothetical protein